MPSRRDFLESLVVSAAAIPVGARRLPLVAGLAPRGFIDVQRPPDSVMAQTARGDLELAPSSDGRWTSGAIAVTTTPGAASLGVSLAAPGVAVKRVQLRWRGDVRAARFILGDAWERGYGDLEWRGWVPDRVMPWYFATTDGSLTHSYGVRTAPNAFCFWQVDPGGASLWIDVRSGGVGVDLGDRTLDACEVVSRAGRAGESAFAAIRGLCRQMCRSPRMPAAPLYGSNDWYWAYGRNSADSVRTDAAHVVELSPSGRNRPFVVIDDGWQPGRGADKTGAGRWDHGNEKFGDMSALAADVKRAGARPGVWIRPLQAPADAPEGWRSSRDRTMLDPSVAEVREKIAADVTRIRGWGYELVKHDYTTYDVFGRWGYQMGAAMTRDGWTFAAGPSRTTAEVIKDLYSTIRQSAGDALVLGCNTVSHLSAGMFDACRIGDDTSGTEWARTRKMGVNTLAFRGVQHGAFYAADADCVGVTNAVPWSMTRQWLDLVARSGTPLFVSLAPDALSAERRRDLRAALARAAESQPLGEPLDWERTVCPGRWKLDGREFRYDWVGPDGAGPP